MKHAYVIFFAIKEESDRFIVRGIPKILTQLLIEIEKLLKVTFKKVFCFLERFCLGPKTITAVFSSFNFKKLKSFKIFLTCNFFSPHD